MNVSPAYQKKISKRAKRLSITVHPDKRVIVTVPEHLFFKNILVNRFITKHAQWIDRSFTKTAYVCQKISYPFSYKKYKEYAREKINDRLTFLCTEKELPFKYKRVCIRDQKTRWGSCSNRDNLNFNYKLAFLPKHLQDYIIIHELCHLKELHHGPSFWSLVEQFYPNYKRAERELRERFKL